MYHFVSILCGLLIIPAVLALNTTVSVTGGWVQGKADTTHMYWLGIPYAQAPIGSLRWQPPQPPQPWSGVKQTTAFGSECTQNGGGTEDCLFLNVFTPINSGGKLLPVYVWVHGGGFVTGSGNLNGEYISGNDIVVVSINYRLGTLGFFATETLLNESSTTGFYGIQDQRFAFAWVQKNIMSFGGDPTKVTIGGESAGGNSMCLHLVLPKSGGLFRGIIMESGLCGVWNWDQGIAQSAAVISNAGCSGSSPSSELECMMTKNSSFLVSSFRPIGGGFVYYPTMHAYEIDQYPLQLVREGLFNKVPMLAGTNLNESSIWVCGWGNITTAQYSQYLNAQFNATVGPLAYNLYSPSSYPSPLDALKDLCSDIWFKCITEYVLLAISSHNPDDQNYLYSFEHITSTVTNPCYGVTHGAELGYVFGFGGTPEEEKLSLAMRNWWVSFIVSGKPAGGPIEWPAFDATMPYMILNLNLTTGTGFRQQYCEFWNTYTFPVAIQP